MVIIQGPKPEPKSLRYADSMTHLEKARVIDEKGRTKGEI
jgi:hypothetical protein